LVDSYGRIKLACKETIVAEGSGYMCDIILRELHDGYKLYTGESLGYKEEGGREREMHDVRSAVIEKGRLRLVSKVASLKIKSCE
jgi:hypothetical protein